MIIASLFPFLMISALAGCIGIPVPTLPSGEVYSFENDIDDLVDKAATKNEVISELGMPIRYSEMSYRVCREGVGVWIMPCPECVIPGKSKCYYFTLEFNENNHLVGYKKYKPYRYFELTREKTKQQISYLANQGDGEAQYDMYGLVESRGEKLKWLCRSAVSGYPLAQAEVGRIYRWGLLSVKQDYQMAYLWYRRANKQKPYSWEDETADARNMAVSTDLQPVFESDSNELLLDQCMRDLVGDL